MTNSTPPRKNAASNWSSLDMDVRLVRRLEKVEGIDQSLSEVWGVTAESRQPPLRCRGRRSPPEAPLGDVWERAKVVGYFFKMQAYYPGDC